MLRVASFFAGIGGFDLGLEKAGMDIVFQCEINSFCQKVLEKHWPDVPLHGDINSLEASTIPDADLWCGGFPCQDVSLANQGKRKGLKGDRSGLFFKFADLIEARRPTWVILENVPGLLNSHSGEDFRVILQRLDELGYGIAWRVFDAKYFGTPQRRRRVFLVASLGDDRSARVLFEDRSPTVVTKQGIGEKKTVTSQSGESDCVTNIYSIQHAGIGRKPSAGPQAKGYRNDGETYTLDSQGSADAVCKTDAPFRVREASGLSSRLDGNRYRAIGNAVCVHTVQWIGERITQIHSETVTSPPLKSM